MADYVLDDVKPSDEPFIFNSWIKSYRQSPEGSSMGMNAYCERQHKRISIFLARSTFVMLRPDDWDEGIVGYVCAERRRDTNCFHYGFVKSGYRKSGLGARLLAEVTERVFERDGHSPIFTHLREPYTKALERHGYKFNPFYID